MLGEYNIYPTIAVGDLAKARRFYEDTLGLSVSEEDAEKQIVVYESGDGLLEIYVSSSAGTNEATYATWEVSGIEACIEDLKGKGVEFEHYPDLPGTTLEGDVHVSGDERAAWFKDPDGNVLCLHSR